MGYECLMSRDRIYVKYIDQNMFKCMNILMMLINHLVIYYILRVPLQIITIINFIR